MTMLLCRYVTCEPPHKLMCQGKLGTKATW